METYLIDKLGVKLSYRKTEGKGPGVIFLGGFRSDMTGSKAVYLENRCREWGISYVRFDYFGHGISDGKFVEGTIGRWLADTLRVLDELTTGPQILVGSSMGGWLMLLAALARPDRIQALVGIAAAPDFLKDFGDLAVDQKAVLAEKGFFYFPSSLGYEPYPISKELIEEAKQHYLLEGEIPVNCPVRLLQGLSDEDVQWEKSIQIAQRLTSNDVMITLVKGGDHRLAKEAELELLGDIVGKLKF